MISAIPLSEILSLSPSGLSAFIEFIAELLPCSSVTVCLKKKSLGDFFANFFSRIFRLKKLKLCLTSNSCYTWWPRSYRKYILQITQHSQYRYAKLQYRFAVIYGSPSICASMSYLFLFKKGKNPFSYR